MLRLLEGSRPGGIEKNRFLGVSGRPLSLPNLARMNMSQARPLDSLIAHPGSGIAQPSGTAISITKNKNKGTHDNLIQFFLSYQRQKERLYVPISMVSGYAIK